MNTKFPDDTIQAILANDDIFMIADASDSNNLKEVLASGIATYLQDKFLSKTNVEVYIPTTDYHPATKKYVDDVISTEDFWNRVGTTLYPNTLNDDMNLGTGDIFCGDIYPIGNIELDSSASLGLGSGKGAIHFTDDTQDLISFLNASIQIDDVSGKSIRYDSTSKDLRIGDKVNLGSSFSGDGRLILRTEGANSKLRITTIGEGHTGYLAFDYCRGTIISPSYVCNGDTIATIVGVGYSSFEGFVHGPQINMKVIQDWSNLSHASGFEFYTVKSMSTTQNLTATLGMLGSPYLILPQSDSRLGVGVNPSNVAHFKGTNQYVLRLEQSTTGSVTTVIGPSSTGTLDFADIYPNAYDLRKINFSLGIL